MDSREKVILKTLLYADIFDYPLTKEEIFRFLIAERQLNLSEVSKVLKKPKLPVEKKGKYFYLKGREPLIEKREKREKSSSVKLHRAREIIKKTTFIPSIKFIGISGALSMRNSDEDDDIDFFVITEKNLAWTTRLFLVIFLSFLGVYRNRQSKTHANKICLNLILDENHMSLGKTTDDLYTAHEISQLLPIFNKENTYQTFIKRNLWAKKYLPNSPGVINVKSYKNSILNKILNNLFKILQFEKTARFLQLKYMKGHITNEITEAGFLKFHPFDYKNVVLKKYKRALSKYKI